MRRPGGTDPFDALPQPGHGGLGGDGGHRRPFQGRPPGRHVFQPEDQAPQGDVDREEQDRDHEQDLADRLRGVHGGHRHTKCLRDVGEHHPAAGLRDRLQRRDVGAKLAILGGVRHD